MTMQIAGYAYLTTVTNPNQAIGTSDITTNSTSFSDMADMSITLTTSANSYLLIFFSADIGHSELAGDTGAKTRLVIDGSAVSNVLTIQGGGVGAPTYAFGGTFTHSLSYVKTGLSAGSHTVKIQWAGGTNGSNAINNSCATGGAHRILQVIEVLK